MRFAILSDLHLGFKFQDRELGQDSFENARKAFEKIADLAPDFVLIAGDIFDKAVPPLDVWDQATKLFTFLKYSNEPDVKVEGRVRAIQKEGLPIIAIYGNHERRPKGFVNAVQLLDSMNLVIYLHNTSVRVGDANIFGFGSVPERFARETFKRVNPLPLEGYLNIFMMHQSIKGVCPDPDTTLTFQDLPRFQMIVCGHVHVPFQRDIGGSIFISPGSTVVTYLRKEEAECERGFFFYDDGKLKFFAIDTRPFIYKEFVFEGESVLEVIERVREFLQNVKSGERKPIVKVVLKGFLKRGERPELIDFRSFEDFSDQMLLVLDKKLMSEEFHESYELLRKIKEKRLPLDALAQELVRTYLRESGHESPIPLAHLLNALTQEKHLDELLEELLKVEAKEAKVGLMRWIK